MSNAVSLKFNLRPGTWVWLVLMGLTLVVFMIGQTDLNGTSIVTLLLFSTLLKTQLVADYFMGLKHSRPLWRLIVLVYLWVIVAMIGLAYYLGIA
jgi:caa(3)-type oxidase subunit IV